MNKKETVLLIITGMLIFTTASAVDTEKDLSVDELNALLSGKTVQGINLENKAPFIKHYAEDRTVPQNVKVEIQDGKSFIDEQGRQCTIWSGMEKKCKVVIKDSEPSKELTLQKNDKPKVTVIYTKKVDGNPER